MQVQKVNNQQSFTAKMYYERAVPARIQQLVKGKRCVSTQCVIEDQFSLEAGSRIEELKKWLTTNPLKRVFGGQKTNQIKPDAYNEPIAVKKGEDLVVLEESLEPTNSELPSIIRVLFGKDASEGVATFSKEMPRDYSKQGVVL